MAEQINQIQYIQIGMLKMDLLPSFAKMTFWLTLLKFSKEISNIFHYGCYQILA